MRRQKQRNGQALPRPVRSADLFEKLRAGGVQQIEVTEETSTLMADFRSAIEQYVRERQSMVARAVWARRSR